MYAKVTKWGNSLGLRIPAKAAEDMDLHAGDRVSFHMRGETLVMQKEPEVTLDKLFEGYDGTSVPEEIDWGDPEGEEIW